MGSNSRKTQCKKALRLLSHGADSAWFGPKATTLGRVAFGRNGVAMDTTKRPVRQCGHVGPNLQTPFLPSRHSTGFKI